MELNCFKLYMNNYRDQHLITYKNVNYNIRHKSQESKDIDHMLSVASVVVRELALLKIVSLSW